MQYIQLQGQNPSEMDTPIEGSYNLFADGLDGSIKLIDSEGNWYGSGSGLLEITYSGLRSLQTDSSLIPGTYYKITDFKTCYDQPDFNYNGLPITTGNYKQGNVSPIIVFATSDNTISELAHQPEYPGDVIHYDLSFSVTEVTGGAAFGRITYRKDNQGNSFDYDFREVLFKRYDAYISEEVYDGNVSISSVIEGEGIVTGIGTTFTNFNTGDIVGILNISNDPLISYYEILSIEDNTNMVVTGRSISVVDDTRLVDANVLTGMSWKKNNITSNTNEYEYPTFTNSSICFGNTSTQTVEHTIWQERIFLLSNNVFRDGAYIDNSFGNGFRNNTFNDDCDSNVIRSYFYNNIINNDFDHNTINDVFYDNVIDVNFNNNLVMAAFFNNNLGDNDVTDFGNNIFKGLFFNNYYIGYDLFRYNTLNRDFFHNIILRGFSNNNFGFCSDNTFNGYFNGNIVGNDFYSNTIYHDFYQNTIGTAFENNTLGISSIGQVFEHNYISYGFKGNLISGNFEQNKIGYGFVSNEIGNDFYSNIIGDYFVINGIADNFADNAILNYFADNNIGSDFKNNKIGNYFYSNTVDNDFGFGGGQARGNSIGNYFYNNNIGEYFYDNNIGDNFESNTIGSYFQFNRIETGLNGYDFTAYLGRLSGGSIPTGVSGTDGVYTGISQTSTTGIGTGAIFSITVSGGVIIDISVTSNGNLYQESDTITISSSAFGGTEPLVMSDLDILANPMVYGNYNKTIQRRFDGTPMLTALADDGTWYVSEYITEPID